MRNYSPQELAYISAGFDSPASEEICRDKLICCLRRARWHSRHARLAHKAIHAKHAHEAIVDARYWQAALVKYAKPIKHFPTLATILWYEMG